VRVALAGAAVVALAGAQAGAVEAGAGAANGWSTAPAVSADGRFIAFVSGAPNLVPGDTNGAVDVFVRDWLAGTTERVSVSSGGEQGNGLSGASGVAISADGRFVAFESLASNLDTNTASDIFVRDRKTGTTTRVSLGRGGRQANGESEWPTISADARYVAFTSRASNLVPGDTNESSDVFVRDRLGGTTDRVSVGSRGKQWNDDSENNGQAISANGRFVTFKAYAAGDVFVRDRSSRTTERVSVSSSGEVFGAESFESAISADGRFVAFRMDATRAGVFVRDRLRHKTEVASVSSSGKQANGDSFVGTISGNGRFVAFASRASNLVAHDTNARCGPEPNCLDLFVRDRSKRTTERVSVNSAGKQANGNSEYPAISANGRFVAFASEASNLVAGDTNRFEDVFLHDRVTRTTVLISVEATPN
jgi:Tol biopolymer transport system component